LRRLFSFVFLILLIFVVCRSLVRGLPGDPIETMVAESGTSISIQDLKKEMGLDQPFLTALKSDLKKAIHGDFGRSLITRNPILPVLLNHWSQSLKLGMLSLIVGVILSLVVGLSAAANPTGKMDRLCSLYGGLAAGVPTIWVGICAILIFSVWVPLIKSGEGLILPVMTLAFHFGGFWARLVREKVRGMLYLGPAVAARARGVHEIKVILKYGLMPVSGSLLAFLSTQIGFFLGGSYVIEVLFNRHGLGSLLVDSVLRRDYPFVEWITFLSAVTILSFNSLGDWLQSRIEAK
jgi:ABC-type dipeptide/oligopeptide/nickel transport system permease component